MDIIFIIALAALGYLIPLAAIGGELWNEHEPKLLRRITTRGWIAIISLTLSVPLAILKEVRSNTEKRNNEEQIGSLTNKVMELNRIAVESDKVIRVTADGVSELLNTQDPGERYRLAALVLDNLFSLNKPAVVKVRAFIDKVHREKTGFFVTRDGYILTADFAVVGASGPVPEVEVETSSGKVYPAKVVQVNPEIATAILKVEGDAFSCIELARRPPVKGEQVLIIGSTEKEFLTRIAGQIGRLEETYGYYFRERNILWGFGGGPMIDYGGEALGLNWGSLEPVEPPVSGMAKFVRADKIRSHILARHEIPGLCGGSA